ncbi:hypothetical protein BH10PLA2_BH10PLA2_19520 [soil metagenome]
MALHPFQSFRKHQRSLFAVLTIVCMLSFVMSSGIAGVGDGFSWLQQVLTGSSKYPQVGTLYKKNIDTIELRNLGNQRAVANRYMVQAVFRSHENIIRQAEPVINQLESQQQTQLMQVLQMRRLMFDSSNPAARQYLQYFQSQYLQNLPQYGYQLLFIQQNLTKSNKGLEAEKIGLLRLALEGERYLMQNPKDDLYPNSDLYFGGALTQEGLMDFMIWEHEADRLGIYLSREDIVRAIQLETLGKLTNEDGLIIERSIIPRGERSSPVDLVKAIGDELRVRLAQTTLLGFDPGGVMRVPAAVTPNEFYTYFTRNRTELDVKVLPIPVSKFIDQVKEKPTDEELTKLFDQYKNFEYHPQSETPGFKQPRRVKVEWIGAKVDAPFYRKEARKWILGALAALPGNPWAGIAALDPVIREYNELTTGSFDGGLNLGDWTTTGFARSFETYAHLSKPESVASLVGNAAGILAGGNGLIPLIATQSAAHLRENKAQQTSIEAEARRRAPACAAFVTSALAPVPVFAMPYIWLTLKEKKHYFPMEVVQNRLIAKLEGDLSKDILKHNLDLFKKEMEATKGNVAEANKVIDKFVKQGAWEHESSTTLDDVFSLAQDPKLAKLREAYLLDRTAQDPKAKFFGFQFMSGSGRTAAKLYSPEEMRMPFGSDATYYFWHTADEPAKVLTFEQAKPAVEKAWRFQKARELAKQEAERIVKQSPSDPVPAMLDAAKKLGETPFDLYRVAYVRPAIQSRAMGGREEFEQYKAPENLIEFPPTNLVEKVMTPGTLKSAVVLADQPGNIQYVAVVTNRIEPTVAEFQRSTSSYTQNRMLATIEQEKRVFYRFEVMNNLREQAGMKINEAAAAQAAANGAADDEN